MPHGSHPFVAQSLAERQIYPFEGRLRNLDLPFPFNPDTQLAAFFQSQFVDTRGLTLHNAFVNLVFLRVQPVTAQLEIFAELVESYGGGAPVGAGRVGVLQQVALGPGRLAVTVPVLQVESQALSFGVTLLGRASEAVRLDIAVKGTLVAGYSIEQRA